MRIHESEYPKFEPPDPESLGAWITGVLDTEDVSSAIVYLMEEYKIGKRKLYTRMGWTKEYVEKGINGTDRVAAMNILIAMLKELNHPAIFVIYKHKKPFARWARSKTKRIRGFRASKLSRPRMVL